MKLIQQMPASIKNSIPDTGKVAELTLMEKSNTFLTLITKTKAVIMMPRPIDKKTLSILRKVSNLAPQLF